ncbi:MAG: bifunctional phosphopantothenoylcysteine decarboxylase/phosphopantothenate--cysteine ligase CoaBC [Methylococcales bacterium]|nr:bifunctional phosphopantothenoylcysteine decarboxylase/phosphopantothenate--cysteine ligase CoaBC [Methylococcales bacterium]
MLFVFFWVKTINNRIILGVCGGIAAYKSAELVRLLRKQDNQVRVVMTHSAMQFISPLTFQALSGNSVSTELLDAEEENAMGHINLARWADKLVIAPATANIIAKLTHGLADDLLSTLYLATNCPVYIAPAMNHVMWNKAVTQENILRLQTHGVQLIGPESGDQACGEVGFGRMSEASDIVLKLTEESCSDYTLQSKNILISAGPTREFLDPVRYITNRSSGKMGYALAEAALNAGAKVTLISGPVNLTSSDKITRINVETAEQMHHAVLSRADKNDIYIGAAAVADYTPASISLKKIKKQANESTIQLQKTRDILTDVAALKNKPNFIVGFAAETDDLEHYAKNKLKQKKLDMIAANWVGQEQGGFDKDENALQVYWNTGSQCLEMTNKTHLAKQLINLITERVNEKNST